MISTEETIVRLLLGAVMGGIIGFERQSHGRPAGFRTQLIVCVASVLIMIVSEYYHNLSLMDPSYVRVDPARIAAGAITGVGFLGAGVILKMGTTIQGLTTAACIWAVSSIGLAVGTGLYVAASATFIITFVALLVFRTVEARMPKLIFRSVTIVTACPAEEQTILSVLSKHGMSVGGMDFENNVEKGELTFHLSVASRRKIDLKAVSDDFVSLGCVKRVTLKG